MSKKIGIAIVLITTFFTQFFYAQYCGNSGSNICVPGSGLSYLDGFKPPYDSLPCAQKGVFFDQTIRFVVPPTVTSGGSTYNLNWLEIATLGNLPCGLCWSTNKAASGNVPANRFNKNEQACIRVTGTTYDNPGQFKLTIFVNVNVQILFTNVTQNNQDASSAGLKYYIRVEQNNGTCPNVDTFAIGNTASSLGADFAATVSAGGATTFCDGGSVVLTAGPTQATSYQWYNGTTLIQGATSPTYTALTSGNYNVKVVKGCKGFTSANTTVTVNPRPAAAITPAGPVQLCNNGTQVLTASPAGASYVWLNNGSTIGGQTAQTYTASTTGSYSVSVTNNGCSSVSNVVTVSTGGSNVTVTPTASSQTICAGQTVTLDAGAGFSSYAWSGGGNGRTKDVTAASTYTVTITLSSGGCTSTGTGSITITNGQNVPAITSLPATTSGCVGTAVVLDAGADYTSYSWTGGGTTQTITPVNSGPYTVTVTKTGFCGNATATTNLTINPLPQITLLVTPDPAIACPNQPTSLDAGAGYDSYLWSNNATTQIISGEVDSTYRVTVTKTALGCTATEFKQVTVTNSGPPDAPDVNPTYAFCAGDSAYVAAGFGFDSYQWSTGDTTEFIRPKTGGTYTVTVTQPDRCGTTIGSTVVTENALPDASFTNSGGVLTATTTSGVTYTWYKNNAPISNSNSPTYTPTETGNYSLQVNDGTCSNRSSAISISVGINEIGKAIQLMAVPNPTSGALSIRFNLPQPTEMNLKVMDMAGRVLLENNNTFNEGQNQLPLDISNFNSGLYLLNLQTKEGKATLIISKQ